jgi:hypothetical protein
MSKVTRVPIRVTAIEWRMGCKQWFSDEQIVENRQQFAAFEAERPRDSIMFIHEGCIERLLKIGVLLKPS